MTTTRERLRQVRRAPRPEVEVIGEEVDPRIAARREEVASERRRFWQRRWFRALTVLLVVGLLAGGAELALHSPLLDVEIIDVLGATRLDDDSVAEAAGVHVGEAMISVDPDATAARLRRNPWVTRATVQRHWPGVVEIRVDERKPTAVLADPAKRTMAIATGGMVVGGRADLGDTRADGIVRTVQVAALPKLEPGQTLPEPLRTTIEAVGALPASVVALDAPVRLSAEGELSFDVAKGRTVRFGDGREAGDKFVAIASMLGGSVDMTGYCVLDVRLPSTPKVVRAPYC